VVVRTSAIAIALVAAASGASADPSDAEIIGRDPGWRIEDVELRTSYLDQHGHGYQSQDGPVGQPGGEAMWLVEPYAMVTVRQSENVVHEITVPVDAITAASPDAVDAVSSASLRNAAVDVEIRTTIRRSERDTLSTRFAGHHEEPMSGGTAGAGWVRSLADANATVGVNGTLIIDGFDFHDHTGHYLGKTARETANLSVTGSQLLSPTTVIDGSYGVTVQHGTLNPTGWNAVPTSDGLLADEVMPRERVRHALTVRIAQHVPLTRSTVKLWYRAYADDFGLRASTVEANAYQYLAPWVYVRGGYRYHHQSGVAFFTTRLATPFDSQMSRTSDSDLAPLAATEWSLQIATVRARGPLGAWSVSAELLRYVRTNDLQITTVSFAIGCAL
jgi:hypothetical protein